MADQYLTAKQAAAEIGMSVQWLYWKVKSGGAPPFKKRGKKLLFPKEELKAWDRQPIIP